MAICNGKNVIVVYRNGKRIRIVGALTSVTPEALAAPEISLDGDTLTMTATDSNTQEFVIFVDGVETETVAYMEFDLSALGLSEGTYSITVKARASGYEDSPASNAVSYVVAGEETYTVSGTWVFNEDLGTIQSTEFPTTAVNFTSNGIAYTSIWCEVGTVVYGNTYVYDMGWTNEAYRTITFDGVQTVSKEFYEWFVANAVQQTIGFTIEGTQYFADVGMTWEQWVASSYNTDGYIVYTDPYNKNKSIRPKNNPGGLSVSGGNGGGVNDLIGAYDYELIK